MRTHLRSLAWINGQIWCTISAFSDGTNQRKLIGMKIPTLSGWRVLAVFLFICALSPFSKPLPPDSYEINMKRIYQFPVVLIVFLLWSVQSIHVVISFLVFQIDFYGYQVPISSTNQRKLTMQLYSKSLNFIILRLTNKFRTSYQCCSSVRMSLRGGGRSNRRKRTSADPVDGTRVVAVSSECVNRTPQVCVLFNYNTCES